MKKYSVFLFVIVTMFLLTGCAKVEPLTKDGIYFDTFISISIYDKKDPDLLDACFDKCKLYESMFSATLEGSEIWNLNHANGEPVRVSDETLSLIQSGIYYSQLSNGSFDITIAPLSSLWNFSSSTHKVPAPTELEACLPSVNYENIEIRDHEIRLNNQASIDLGGIAKGYIGDQLKSFLEEQGVKKALINLGGNIVTLGSGPNQEEWNIGIQRPFENGEIMTSVSVQDLSVVSSGVYQRYFEENGAFYHHILNPKTGYPFDTDLLSATILSQQSVDGDALSTICMTLGLEKSLAFLQNFESVRAVFITKDYQIHYANWSPK